MFFAFLKHESGRAQWLQFSEDGCADFAGFGVASERFFREDQFAVDRDLETPAGCGDEFP